MSVRHWFLPALLLVIVSAVVIIPATGAGREWLLQRGVAALESAGYDLTYREAEGNPWFGVELSGARIRGLGLDLQVAALELDYFLPSLLTGELPVSLGVAGVRGEVDLDSLATSGGSRGNSAISLELRELNVSDVEVDFAGVPWTLPPLAIEDVAVSRRQDSIDFEARLRSSEGEARLAGALRLGPWNLDVEVLSADARLARHWWDGVEAGTVQGRVVADGEAVAADLVLAGGEVSFLGAEAKDIAGPISFEHGVVKADLQGRGLSGRLQADISVDTAAQEWRAGLQGRPELSALASWLAKGTVDPEALALEGAARVDLRASGWSSVRLEGVASGAGSILGQPLSDLDARFEFESSVGTTLDAAGSIAGGPLRVKLRPAGTGMSVDLDVESAELLPGLEASFEVTTRHLPQGVSGKASARLQGQMAGRSLLVSADALLDDDGLQLYLAGEDDRGGTIDSAAVLADGQLQGRLSLRDILFPGLAGPIDASLAADGPLTQLPLSLEISGPGLEEPEAYGLRWRESFQGRATGTLVDAEIRDIEGDFGPLALNGDLALAPLRLDLEYRIVDLQASGRAEIDVATAAGEIDYQGGEAELSGTLDLTRLAAGGAELGPLELLASGSWNGKPSFRFASVGDQRQGGEGGLLGHFDEDGLEVTFDEPPLALSGRTVKLSGAISGGAGSPLAADLLLGSEQLELRVEPAAGGHRLEFLARPGLSIGPITLAEPLQAAGEVDEQFSELRLKGTLPGGGVQAAESQAAELQVTVQRGESGLSTSATVRSENRQLDLAYDLGNDASAGQWSVGGELELSALASLLDLPVSGLLTGEIASGAQGYQGVMTARGEVAGTPLDLQLSGSGSRIELQGEALAAAVPWRVTGTLLPELTLQASSQHGSLALADGTISGSGLLPDLAGPVDLAPQEWSVQGELADSRLLFSAGASRATVDWSEGLSVQADVEQEFHLYGVPAALRARLDQPAQGEGQLKGEVTVAGETLDLAGDLGRLRLHGNLDAAALSEAWLDAPALAGVLALDASASLPSLDELTIELSLEAGDSELTGELQRRAGEWRGRLQGAGLEAQLREDSVTVSAHQAHIRPFLGPALSGLGMDPKANGSLSFGRQEGWAGTMELALQQPASRVALSGAGEELALEASLSDGSYSIQANGPVFPELGIELTGEALSKKVLLNGELSGTLGSPSFVGQLENRALAVGPLELPGGALALTADLPNGARLRGEGVDLTVTIGEVSGEFDLELLLAGAPHRLQGIVSGTPAHPTAELEVVGDVAAGAARWQGESLRGELALDPSSWLSDPLMATAPVEIELSAGSDGSWQGSLLAHLELAGAPLAVAGELAGELTNYQGRLQFDSADGRLLEAIVSGEGSDWSLTADLASSEPAALSELLPGQSALQPSGTVLIRGAPLAIEVDARVDGTVAGQPLSMLVDRREGEPLMATVEGGGVSLSVEATQGGLTFTAMSPSLDSLEVNGELAWSEGLQLRLAGNLGERELQGSGQFQPPSLTGQFRLSLGDSWLELEVAERGEGISVEVIAENAGEQPLALPFSARALLVAEDGTVTAETLEAALHLDGDTAVLALSGPLWPEAAATGALEAPLPGTGGRIEADAQISGDLTTAPLLRLSREGLALRAQRSESGWRTDLAGSGTLPGGLEVRSAQLSWSEAQGFAGTAAFRSPLSTFIPDSDWPSQLAPLERFALAGELRGDGSLLARVDVSEGESQLAVTELQLTADPWSNPALDGTLEVTAELGQLWPAYAGEPLAMTGTMTVEGSLTQPSLAGPVATAGALDTVGSAQYGHGHASLELKGEQLTLQASRQPTGEVEAEIGLDDYALGSLLTEAAGTSLDLLARVRREPHGRLSADISSFSVERGDSSAVGAASIGDEISASAQVQLNLIDLPLNAPLAGSLEGALELQADSLESLGNAALRGDLQLQGASLVGGDSSLSGSVAVSGPASDPRFSLDLAARGKASGGLAVEAAPASGRLSLRSDLRWGPLLSDVEVLAVQGNVQASGEVELPGGRFLVSAGSNRADSTQAGTDAPGASADRAALILDGQGSYRGWRLEYQPGEQRFELDADLASIAEGVRGRLSLQLGDEQGSGRWLSAHLAEVGWGPVTLGDVQVESASPGAEIVLAGPALQASLRPSEGFAWTLEQLELQAGGTVTVSGSGSGRGGVGRIEALASGELAGKEVSLPVAVELGEQLQSLAGAGRLLGGDVELSLRLEDGHWSGGLQAEGLALEPATARISGTLTGPVDDPMLTLAGQASAPNFAVTGESSLTLTEQKLDLNVESPLLDSPLTLTASRDDAWSATLSSPDGEGLLLQPAASTGAPLLSGALAVSVGPLQVALLATGAEAEAVMADRRQQTPPAAGATDQSAPAATWETLSPGDLLVVATVPDLQGLTFTTRLPAAELVRPGRLLERPLELTGRDQASGRLELSLSPLSATLAGVSYRSEEIAVSLNGRLGLDESGELSGLVELLSPASAGFLPALPPGTELPFRASTEGGSVVLSSASELGIIEANYQIGTGNGRLNVALGSEGSSVAGEFTFEPSVGPSGTFSVEDFPLIVLTAQEPLRLTGDFEVDPKAVTGSARLSSDRGVLRASGSWGLGLFLPSSLAPDGATVRRLEVQLGTFDLQSLPLIARRLPHLTAPLSGFLQLQGRDLVGRLVAPDMAVSDQPLPLAIDVSGTVEEVELRGVLAGSTLQLTLDAENLAAVATLDRFPLHLLAEAATGPTDVSAELTGVARLVLPFQGSQGLVVELATEHVRLERSGVVSSGNLSVVFADGELSVKEAEFGGAGRWRAEGSIRPDLLDFRLTANEADFTPLLGLVPALAHYRVGAQGSLELRASGDFSDPVVTLASPALEFEVAGSKYLLQNGEASLRDDRLAFAALVSGLSPVTGQLTVAGGGRLELQPLDLKEAQFSARGAADVPGLGEVRNFEAQITSRPETGLWLQGGGELGSRFELEGALAPLDVQLIGEDLLVRLPQLLLASAQVDADLRLRWEEAFRFSGELGVDQARFELGIRPQRSAGARSPNPLAEQFVFDSVAIRAPGRVRFDENFGSAETSLDLTLTGTAAHPLLAGRSEVVRGTFQFSGRDFQIVSGAARFDPSRGVLPLLEVEAVTTFDSNRVQPGDGGFRFVAPRDGGRFEVTLAFTGEVEPAPGENPPFRLDLSPSLSSSALIQEVRADGLASGPRSLSEPELLSLITLGRLELNAPLAGQSGLATAVAEGALDTAVDLLFVSELQSALAEALGLDVVEIRTTALSSVLGRSNSDPFSVSLRLGGYLSDEVFASYRIGSFDDVRGLYALTNEVSLLYELGPLELDLAGRVNFEDTRAPSPATELSATIRYGFDGLTSLEGGIDLSDDRQQVRFGVTLRW